MEFFHEMSSIDQHYFFLPFSRAVNKFSLMPRNKPSYIQRFFVSFEDSAAVRRKWARANRYIYNRDIQDGMSMSPHSRLEQEVFLSLIYTIKRTHERTWPIATSGRGKNNRNASYTGADTWQTRDRASGGYTYIIYIYVRALQYITVPREAVEEREGNDEEMRRRRRHNIIRMIMRRMTRCDYASRLVINRWKIGGSCSCKNTTRERERADAGIYTTTRPRRLANFLSRKQDIAAREHCLYIGIYAPQLYIYKNV